MHLYESTAELESYIQGLKAEGKTIGFTPTMGALHDGHFQLVKRTIDENDISICSVFVNPTQFNQTTDLEKYPRTLAQDREGLERTGCHILFAPSVEDIYPDGADYEVEVDLGGLDELMEGAHRPGHFTGVVQVVKRLIEITSCDRLYMGQKDFQQFTIIQRMIDELDMPTELVVCPIIREEDGLARSSRNRRLTEDNRSKANILHRMLLQAKDWLAEGRSPIEISYKAMEYLDIPGFKPEYFDLIDGKTLKKVSQAEHVELVVACTAVWAGDVRLIDNMILKGAL